MRTKITVYNIHEAIKEIERQLMDKSFFLDNYNLLESCDDYLDKCLDKDDDDFDKSEQLFNFLAYDLNWENRQEELFPMEL